MPDPALLTDAGREYLEALPIFLREDPDMIAVAYCYGKEHERQMEFLDRVQANLLPTTADELTLAIWEALLGVQAGTMDIPQRLAVISSRWHFADGSGDAWLNALSYLIGPGWEYLEHVPGVPTTPSWLELYVRVPYAPTSDEYRRIQDLLFAITPANLTISLQSLAGFALDVGTLDGQPL